MKVAFLEFLYWLSVSEKLGDKNVYHTKFTAILLNEFPVTFQCFIFVRFSIKLIHDLDAKTIHSSSEMLYNVKTIQDNFSVWE